MVMEINKKPKLTLIKVKKDRMLSTIVAIPMIVALLILYSVLIIIDKIDNLK